MKKAKLLLLSLALFTILGAVLAFKAKPFGTVWCVTTAAIDQDATKCCCIFLWENRTSQVGAPTLYATYLDEEGNAIISSDQCELLLSCKKARLITD